MANYRASTALVDERSTDENCHNFTSSPDRRLADLGYCLPGFPAAPGKPNGRAFVHVLLSKYNLIQRPFPLPRLVFLTNPQAANGSKVGRVWQFGDLGDGGKIGLICVYGNGKKREILAHDTGRAAQNVTGDMPER